VSRRALPPSPEFFIDRSLGRRHLAAALARCGLVGHTLASVYGEERAQSIADTEWLTLAGEHGWVVLMKDDRIRRRPAEIEALRLAGARAFCLTNANLRAAEQSERFVANRHRIVQRAAKPGPFIDGVYAHGLRRLWPRG
jgi:PIN like domain